MTVNERRHTPRADTGDEDDWFYYPPWGRRKPPPASANAGNPWCPGGFRWVDRPLNIKFRSVPNADAPGWRGPKAGHPLLDKWVQLAKVRCAHCGRRLTPTLVDFENGYRDFGLQLPPHKLRDSDTQKDPIRVKTQRRQHKKRERSRSRGR